MERGSGEGGGDSKFDAYVYCSYYCLTRYSVTEYNSNMGGIFGREIESNKLFLSTQTTPTNCQSIRTELNTKTGLFPYYISHDLALIQQSK